MVSIQHDPAASTWPPDRGRPGERHAPPRPIRPPGQLAPPDGRTAPEQLQPLARHLDALYAVHGLSRRELLAVQRGIIQLHRVGAAPNANEFWEMAALPRAQVLAVVATAAIDRELPAVTTRPAAASWASPGVEAWLTAMVPFGAQINELGCWWQRRLRRAALVRALPSIAWRVPAQAELAISRYEMELLDRPPWCHGDRLLSAFELAHAEIVAHGRQRLSELLGRSRTASAPEAAGTSGATMV